MNAVKQSKLTLTSIISGICFIGALSIGVLFLLKKITILNSQEIYFVNNHSIFVLFTIFFLVFLGIFVPTIRQVFFFLKISRINPFDSLSTILLVTISFIPIIILFRITIYLLKIKKLSKYKYYIAHIFVAILLFLLGVIVVKHGEIDENAKLKPFTHVSPLDYGLILLALGIKSEWNVIAGINLSINKNSLEDKFVAATMGPIIKDYSIPVDRNSDSSKRTALRITINELRKGKTIAWSPNAGRIPWIEIKKGDFLKKFEEDAIFAISLKNKINIQPIVFDFPVIWRGKNDGRWGIHPCVIDIYYLPSINPERFSSVDDLKNACWQAMYNQLDKSKKVKKFLKS